MKETTMTTRNSNNFLSILSLGMLFVLGGCGGKAVVPTSYNTFNADDGSFQLEYPAEWTVESGGKSGFAWANFKSGSAQILVDSNSVGSLIGDIAKTGGSAALGQAPIADESPVALVHEHEREVFEEEGGYKEQKPETIMIKLGEARRSEYTGKTALGAGIRGYRLTALSSEKRIRLTCECPEGEWEALKPAFNKAIETLTRGK
jgi:hypothetical protein